VYEVSINTIHPIPMSYSAHVTRIRDFIQVVKHGRVHVLKQSLNTRSYVMQNIVVSTEFSSTDITWQLSVGREKTFSSAQVS
jgi:hypothetical protein